MPTEHAELESALKQPTRAERDRSLKSIAATAIEARNWPLAAEALRRIESPDVSCQLQLNLARNFAAFQEYRPGVYEALIAARNDARFQITASATGLPTIHFAERPGKVTSLSIDNNPLKGVAAMFAKLRPDIERGTPLALCGLGDGYLLGALAQKPPKLFMTMQHTVHIVEPLPQVLLLCIMIHDYAGEAGPIRQPRFRWYVGEGWLANARDEMLGDPHMPLPLVNISQGIEPAPISGELSKIREELMADDVTRGRELADYYAGISREQWVNLFGSFPDRSPRVMLITTKFSTVLQYSTRDAAQAFGQLGWETLVVIEPSDWQRNTGASIRRLMHDFRPDFVFQIDHHRAEHGQLYPPQLPFACWIQDHLPNLCNHEAGQKIGVRDYVLSNLSSLFVQQHGYPRRQMIDLPQLSRVPMRPTEWNSDGDDLIYVSNWSKPAGEMVAELAKRFPEPPALKTLIDVVAKVVVDVYASGGATPTYFDIRNVVSKCEKASGITITEPELKDKVINAVFDTLNSTLYRHQSLQWAIEIAREQNLKLGLYGRGWDENPMFAAYARGSVTPGEELERLTRSAKINLQLEPYACFSHARLTSGLFAGGFFLIRDHPLNHLPQELLNFVDRVFDPAVCTVDEARRVVKEHHREKLEEMLTNCVCLGEQIDAISLVRDWQRNGTLIAHGCSLPRMSDVLFRDKASFAAAVTRFIGNAQLRYDISTEQRHSTQSRLSYKAGLERVTRAIAKLIAQEQGQSKQAA
jgi:hypothetical protein